MLEECLIIIRDTFLTAATSVKNEFFQKLFFMAPRVAKSVRGSLANTPNRSVAALRAASLVSTAVPSVAVSPDVPSSLPSPVAQPKTLTPRRTVFSSRQGL